MPPATDPDVVEQNIKSILEWLALAHGEASPTDARTVRDYLLVLRETPLPTQQYVKILDLFYAHGLGVVSSLMPRLHDVALPVSRKQRQSIRDVQEMLETMAQEYLNSLAELFDPELHGKPRPPEVALWRAIRCLSAHLMISYLSAAPSSTGIWQKLHWAYHTARRLELTLRADPKEGRTIEQIYLATVLLACCQPASFASGEVLFLADYIRTIQDRVQVGQETPLGYGVFWIDPERDQPASALSRRVPPPDTPVVYFRCDDIAAGAREHLDALENGYRAENIGLPSFADTPAGHGVLRRIAERWGNPAKRRFTRRRQSYRVELCAGLDNLWQLFSFPDTEPENLSSWMITNESPDGCAMMHMIGPTNNLRTGDIVAIRTEEDSVSEDEERGWEVCIVRWAISENPEHIELGIQILAPTAEPTLIAIPRDDETPTRVSGLLLPQLPPLRQQQMLIVPSGTLIDTTQKVMALVRHGNLKVRELRATQMDEQTGCVEAFSVEPDERV